MSADNEAKVLKLISEERKAGARGVRFQLLSIKMMSISMDELWSLLKKMQVDGKISFGGIDGPTPGVPETYRPDLYIHPA